MDVPISPHSVLHTRPKSSGSTAISGATWTGPPSAAEITRPVADEEAEILLFEPEGTLNTGNVETERTVRDLEWL